jgi:hypothetical protein
MSLNYPNQQEFVLLGTVIDTAPPEVVEAVALTTTYAGNISNPMHVEHYAQLTFFVEYKAGADGSGSSVQIKVEGSPDLLQNDSVTPLYYQETASNVSGGTITHTLAEHSIVNASGGSTVRAHLYIPPAYKTIRVSAKETKAGTDAGTIILRALTSGK